jgi:catechol-2,3-dioxygenase
MGEFGRCVGLFQAQSDAPERDYESAGLRHVAFMLGAGDLERAGEHLRERGVDFRFEDHGSAHSLYLSDPDGNVIELTTYELTSA